MRVKPRPHHKASAPAKPHLNGSVVHRWRRTLRLSNWRNFHSHELRRVRFPQPLLPREELATLQSPFTAKRRYALAALAMFPNQPTPLRPYLRPALPHPSSVKPPALPHKMEFR